MRCLDADQSAAPPPTRLFGLFASLVGLGLVPLAVMRWRQRPPA